MHTRAPLSAALSVLRPHYTQFEESSNHYHLSWKNVEQRVSNLNGKFNLHKAQEKNTLACFACEDHASLTYFGQKYQE